MCNVPVVIILESSNLHGMESDIAWGFGGLGELPFITALFVLTLRMCLLNQSNNIWGDVCGDGD